jgi:diacylglycerol kinase (ATP)
MVATEQVSSATGISQAPATLLHAIVNPAAGSGRAGKRWPGYSRSLVAAGFTIQAHVTTGPGDATVMARQLAEQGAETILCVGGDGTTNEVVNGLIAEDLPVNPHTRLAVIPCGTGKDFARTLGTRTVQATIQALHAGSSALVDVGRIQYLDSRTGHLETRYFANVADTGIGAATAARINASSKALGGLVSYLKGAVHSIVVYQPWDVTVEVDGALLYSGDAGMVVFANGRYFAGGMLVAPDASLCDGQLDMFVLELLPRVYRGKHIGRPGVRHVRGASATVRSSAAMLVEMDGEQTGVAPITVSVARQALRVVGASDAFARAGNCGCIAGSE